MRAKRRNNTFTRIGDRYKTFIDPDHFLGQNAFDDSWLTKPATNIRVNQDHYDLEVALPGYEKKEINISIGDGLLEIVAEKVDTKKGKLNERYIQREIDTDRTQKTFHLSSIIDEDQIESDFKNGLLHISLPIKKERKNKKMIAVS